MLDVCLGLMLSNQPPADVCIYVVHVFGIFSTTAVDTQGLSAHCTLCLCMTSMLLVELMAVVINNVPKLGGF